MGSEARARLGLLLLIGATLFAFNQLFADGDYPGPAILGVILAVGIAIGARRLGLSSGLTFTLSGVALIWYLTLIFQARHTFYGLPSPDALRRLVSSVRIAYEHSQVDYAPVPVRPGYVVMVVAALWAIAAIGEVATFRWRRPLIASLPPVALFAFIMVVGTGVAAPLLVPVFLVALFTYWGLESAHRLRSWGRWVGAFQGGDEEDQPESVTGNLARGMGATCVVIALVAPLFLPALGQGLFDWRNDVGAGASNGVGEGEVTKIDPLVSIVPKLITQTDNQLFTVDSDRPEYWRLVTLTAFDGEAWHVQGDTDTGSSTGSIEGSLPAASPGRIVNQTYTMSSLGGTSLPAAVTPQTVAFSGSNAQEHLQNLHYNRDTGDLDLSTGALNDLTYSVTSIVPDTSFSKMQDARIGTPGSFLSDIGAYVQLPPVSQRVEKLATRWTAKADTPFTKLLAIQAHLRRFTYSLDVERSASSDYLEQFLFDTKTGYCQQFATAFAVLSRSLGYPTRVAVGFLPGDPSPDNPNHYQVFGTDAHAWPEVYFDQFGWVAFEPTPRSEAPPPAYTQPPVGSKGGIIGRPNESLNRAPNSASDRRNPAERDTSFRRVGPAGEQKPRKTPPWQKTFTRLLTIVLLLLVIFFIAVPLIKEFRIRRRYSRADDARGRAAAAFAEFQDQATGLVAPRRVSESATSYAGRIASARHLKKEPAIRLARLYEAAEYAPAPISPIQGDEARRLARQIRSNLWKESGWWERAESLFSPAGIRSGSART